ncbi:sensor histidine kinase [Stenotrophomonas sp. NPDC078853]|uniref:sensor histidine kinase n=1 Tax=Stenotrophomonas sp. NPDC078853 TaxID=3364534 RepID=UPI00384DB0CC
MAARPAPLYRRVLGWLLTYLALISLAVFGVGNNVHEHAEHAAWRALLNSEMDSIILHSKDDPDYRWQDSDTLSLFRLDQPGTPAALRGLHPGLHDGIPIGERKAAVMVRQTDTMGRLALALDISDFEALEQFATRWVLLAGLVMVIVTVIMARLGMQRVVRPLSQLAGDIAALKPGAPGQRIVVDPRGSAELHTIANSLNDYLARNEQFVERERVFISTASHELRTPVAVITGAAELALEQPGLAERARQQVLRVQRTAGDMEALIELLLVLARDPARLAARAERIALDQLLPQIIDDHRHLLGDKDLTVGLRAAPVDLVAPLAVVQAAIGNLLRNAIENSGRGNIQLELSSGGVLTLRDPGHGMSPEEIAAIHARMARGLRNEHGGIGLELVARLCEHLGWTLRFEPVKPRGTLATLDVGASRPQ